MSRLIDENDIIKMLNTMDRYTSEELTLCDTDKTFPMNEVFIVDDVFEGFDELPSAQPDSKELSPTHKALDTISRKMAIDAIEEYADRLQIVDWKENPGVPYKAYALNWCINTIRDLPSAQPESKYEYHYDHTDCIWFRPEARNRCPATCAQYRDGWNDAMNYIFRDGKGYRPYRRDKQYGE